MKQVSRRAGYASRWLGVAALGCILSLALYQIWELPPRWSAIVVIAVAAIAAAAKRNFFMKVAPFAGPIRPVKNALTGEGRREKQSFVNCVRNCPDTGFGATGSAPA